MMHNELAALYFVQCGRFANIPNRKVNPINFASQIGNLGMRRCLPRASPAHRRVREPPTRDADPTINWDGCRALHAACKGALPLHFILHLAEDVPAFEKAKGESDATKCFRWRTPLCYAAQFSTADVVAELLVAAASSSAP
jgi:hypothetical protein